LNLEPRKVQSSTYNW